MLGPIAKLSIPLMAIASIMKPILPIIKGIGKMLGAFLQPVGDMLMMILMPILTLLKPILVTFKALMAPFKKAAMAGIAASNKLIATGMKLGAGTEEGGALITEGMKGSLSSASLMFSGFIQTLFGPLAEMFGLGERFESAMSTWQSSALTGIYRAVLLSDTVSDLSVKFGDLRTGASEALGIIDGQMALLKSTVDKFTIKNFENDFNTVQLILDATSGIATMDFNKMNTAAKMLEIPLGTVIGYLVAGVSPLSKLGTNLGDIIVKFDDLNKKLEEKGFLESAKDIAKTKKTDWKAILGAGKIGMAGGAGFGAGYGLMAGGPAGAVTGGLLGGAVGGVSTMVGAYFGQKKTAEKTHELELLKLQHDHLTLRLAGEKTYFLELTEIYNE